MAVTVGMLDDPAAIMRVAGQFLLSKPVLHNVILTLLETRMANPEVGRYWVASCESRVTGMVFQSPVNFPPTLTPMEPSTIEAMVDAIGAAGISLPGVNGEAATTARFAGQWTERKKAAAIPFQGMRLYELTAPLLLSSGEGELRSPSNLDRDLLVRWVQAFQTEVDVPAQDLDRRVDGWISDGLISLWEHDGTKAMAVHTKPVGGVTRIMCVYTPPEFRKRGFAENCVSRLSKSLLDEGYRCALYTDLANPTSNSIYRRIGYRAVAEILRYRFE
ncbi:MAG TPA: GNAT family N-acetyltransferase [Bryobacteraceae bacterium]|jgi:ribosomal protein S18 acetylase RimI-like enzyme